MLEQFNIQHAAVSIEKRLDIGLIDLGGISTVDREKKQMAIEVALHLLRTGAWKVETSVVNGTHMILSLTVGTVKYDPKTKQPIPLVAVA